ncbi:pentatricopeptide repeat-containing protein At2g06000 [Diospyros lotus]|uniref:pentatricopeptide repeat-containing protein At2g06000 n=1 Tax=Diospyros lotus TaxID=55363 RepID=UPI00224F6C11|nr:pentatricopeptide repeat-containing protein At2g06000 [Diospyros lotus]XP_052193341.1 pentatricopeptide repeat-containing protein At2g06000 [Diospyros lotus]XP_052193342.1 pentatricopeptide repeat-containing protein At2g06000 [Diospyros lotus]XP_052193343.1 pentatricopeptide repeat-containing protein At2g06000 [Diospyros lotus]XP_052193344.1 pentatricopeptide repeat-containing protein At2g06000 [Diospyros lotus]XP_052193345.1 pentatricopeptide repeat-containing protein At2g06000 [Diospyros 
MQLWSLSPWRRNLFPLFGSVACVTRSQSKVAPGIVWLHGHSNAIAHPDYSEIWFVKVICTLCIRFSTRLLDVGHSDYVRNNLTPLIAFEVVKRLNCSYFNPKLAFEIFQLTRISLNLIYPPAAYDMLVRSLCQIGFHDLAKLVFEYMRIDGHLPGNSIIGFLVLSFAHAGKFDNAKWVLSIAQSDSIKIHPFVSNNLLSLMVKQNRVQEAVCFFREHILRFECYHPDIYTLNIVLRGLCTVGEVEKAFEFFDEMGSFGCVPDIVTYNTLIDGLCRARNADRGLQLLRDIQSGDLFSPDVVTYTSVISGYCKIGKMEVASNIFDEMIVAGVKPSSVTFNVLIDGFGKGHDMRSAMKIYEKMLFLGCLPDVVTFTSLMDGYCRCGQADQGLKFWDEMNVRNLSPNLYAFSVLINSLCKDNRIYEARDLLRQLRQREDIIPQPFVYNPVIDGFCKAGNVDEANAIVAEMEAKRCNPDKLTFTILIIGHCMKGRMSEAINIFYKMLAIGCAPDDITLNSLISCLLKAGMPNEAFKIRQTATEDLNSGISYLGRSARIRENMGIPVAV